MIEKNFFNNLILINVTFLNFFYNEYLHIVVNENEYR